MIKTFSLVVLLITLFNFGSFAEEIQAFNFTKEEFDNLTVRKIKKNTKYTLGSNDNGNFLKAEAEGQASGLGKEILINLNKTPFLNITWKVEKDLSGIDEKSKKFFNSACKLIGLFDLTKNEWEEFKKVDKDISEEFIEKKIKERLAAKQKGDYKLADKIRVELASKGVIIEDKKEKTTWKFK